MSYKFALLLWILKHLWLQEFSKISEVGQGKALTSKEPPSTHCRYFMIAEWEEAFEQPLSILMKFFDLIKGIQRSNFFLFAKLIASLYCSLVSTRANRLSILPQKCAPLENSPDSAEITKTPVVSEVDTTKENRNGWVLSVHYIQDCDSGKRFS